MESTNTTSVFILFDSQCPHCATLWESSLSLLNKVKFVWIPVDKLNPKSRPQGAVLLSSSNPLATMTAHEVAFRAGQGGIAFSAIISQEMDAAITKNTELLKALNATGVPFIVTKHAKTGAVIAQAGALNSIDLARLLGVD